jgi:coenzyme F420 hydrogenase subunit beta
MMRKPDSIERIVESHLCMGCGACAAARPDLVTMVDTDTHGRRPRPKDGISAAESQLLAQICPGREIRFEPAANYDEAAWGPVLEVWEGHALDPELRFRGSSGGVVSALALHGIQSGAAAGVVQVTARRDEPLLNETVISRSRADVLAASASRYSPASPCERLADVRADGREHIFVGKPCDVAGAQHLMRTDERLRNSVGLTISIFCAGTPSQAATEELIRALNIDDDASIEEIRYRGRGWPGRMAVRYRQAVDKPSKLSSMTYERGWGEFLSKHAQWRCRMCADHLGEHADLSVGDPWYRPIGEGELGESLIVVRTERGRQALRAAVRAGYLAIERRSVTTLAASQPNLERAKGAVFARCLTARAMGGAAPIYRGGALHRVWLRALSPIAKLHSVGGTIKRILKKRILRPERAFDLQASGNS